MKRGPWQVLIALDQLLNAFLWGAARETVSYRTGKALIAGKRWARIVAPIIDFFLGEDHCRKAAADPNA